LPDLLNLLTDIEGVSIGHATDLMLGSGVTAIVFDEPAVASGTVLGGAPGGRDTSLLDPSMTVSAVDAFVLSGGSAFGLDAAGGVQAGLRELGRGFAVGPVKIPIVPQAILMDLLNGGDKDWGLHSPYRDMGYAALKAAAKGAFALGTVGAGTGATTATFKGGLGSASAVSSAGHRIAAVVAVNALGSATIGAGPHFWAAPFEKDGEFGGLGMPASVDHRMRLKGMSVPATTIGAVVTDAQLTKAEAHRLSLAGHDGLARALLPASAARRRYCLCRVDGQASTRRYGEPDGALPPRHHRHGAGDRPRGLRGHRPTGRGRAKGLARPLPERRLIE